MNNNAKLENLLVSYALAQTTTNYLNGKGGNLNYFFFMLSMPKEASNTVETVSITDTAILYNPNWVEASTLSQIRDGFDAQLATATANWKSPTTADGHVDPAAYTNAVNNVNADEALNGKMPDFAPFSNMEKAFVSAKITEQFKTILLADKEKALALVPNLVSMYDAVGLGITLYSVRNHIGLSNMVNFGLDDIESLDGILKKVSQALDSK